MRNGKIEVRGQSEEREIVKLQNSSWRIDNNNNIWGE